MVSGRRMHQTTRLAVLFLALAGLIASTGGSAAREERRLVPTTIHAGEWATFKARFVAGDGRVVDIENDGVSHSEGQGYGLLLAVHADDRAAFRRILAFTMSRMRVRGDALIAWLYEPDAYPRVTDRNNATDGDMLIAWALIEAAVKWQEPRYLAIAEPMVDAIGSRLLETREDAVLVRPAAFGFGAEDHPDGPVVNLSYYVYGALALFEAVEPRHPFAEAFRSGLSLTAAALARSAGHVPDWISMRWGRRHAPARAFAARSSYDAVRIPLYMALGGQVPARHMAPFDRLWNLEGDGAPDDVDLVTGRTVADMIDPGYRAIAALAACAVRGAPMPADLRRFRPTSYFASALHLLALSAARAHYPSCLPGPRPVADGERAGTIMAGSADAELR